MKMQDIEMDSEFTMELKMLETSVIQNFRHLCDSELNLLQFQVQVLKKANSVLKQDNEYSRYILEKVRFVVHQVFRQQFRISSQRVEEVTCELQRLSVLPAFWKLTEKYAGCRNVALMNIYRELSGLLSTTVKFDKKRESRARNLLKESQKFVGGLGISNEERLEILSAMGFKQGHWYKCPNGHIYCISECGGAMVQSKCPECDATIGGERHQLRGDNAVASEMDGALYSAWSEQNNMANYDVADFV
nr:NFX1-type zinc finger-containing protein 1-like [Procambarus clarkii]